MNRFTPAQLADWAGRPWCGTPFSEVAGIACDTRTLQAGTVYLALRGERVDGHAFVEEAFSKGAVGAVVDDRYEGTEGVLLRVPDTLQALHRFAAGQRSEWDGLAVGITGSVGKTTVKELCADVLAQQMPTHRTAGNRNNHIGLPLTLLDTTPEHHLAVVEIGMNHPGEIRPLAQLLRPDFAIVTDLGNAHREHFESLEEIVREKAGLLEALNEKGTALLDRDACWFDLLCGYTAARVVTLALSGDADVRGEYLPGEHLRVNGYVFELPQPGRHMARNTLRAVALGLESGLEPERIEAGLKRFSPPPMRWQRCEMAGVHFINDAYNANPLSMRAALQTFAAMEGTRHWAVLGGMHELGAVAAQEHAALGRFVDGLGLDGLIAVGEWGEALACGERSWCADDSAAAAGLLQDRAGPGDVVLIKASRGERLERVLDFFHKG